MIALFSGVTKVKNNEQRIDNCEQINGVALYVYIFIQDHTYNIY